MIEESDKKNIQKMIDMAVGKSMEYQTRKRGDTPTDKYHLTPKGYVDGAISSVISSIASANASIYSYINTRKYTGFIASNVASTPFPAGWTGGSIGTGEYRITHNLGTTAYGVVLTPKFAGGRVCVVEDRSANTFDVLTYNTSFLATDTDFFFIVSV